MDPTNLFRGQFHVLTQGLYLKSGFRPDLKSGKPQNRPSGLPEGRFRGFPLDEIRAGSPISGPEELLRNIEYVSDTTNYRGSGGRTEIADSAEPKKARTNSAGNLQFRIGIKPKTVPNHAQNTGHGPHRPAQSPQTGTQRFWTDFVVFRRRPEIAKP